MIAGAKAWNQIVGVRNNLHVIFSFSYWQNQKTSVLYSYDSDTRKKEELMEYNSSLPIYLQVANLIKRDIVTGKRELGEKLPSVRELAVSYTINPNTVNRVQ